MEAKWAIVSAYLSEVNYGFMVHYGTGDEQLGEQYFQSKADADEFAKEWRLS